MPGFPLTAWALVHPHGDDAEALLDGLRAPVAARVSPPRTVTVLDSLLEQVESSCRAACKRWGTSRVAVVLGGGSAAGSLASIREHTGISGPSYRLDGAEPGTARALASAHRLLRSSLADAVLVAGIEPGVGSAMMVEKHGEAFVQLVASTESSRLSDSGSEDSSAVTRVLGRAWDAIDRRPLGYAQLQAPGDSALAESEIRAVRAVLGSRTLLSSTPPALHVEGAPVGALGVVLAVVSLVRGYTPEPTPRELEHDRALVHARCNHGHHVALVLEARP